MTLRLFTLVLAIGAAAGAQDGARTPITLEDLYRADGPRTVALAKSGRVGG